MAGVKQVINEIKHLGKIANLMTDWKGDIADALELTFAEREEIIDANRSNLGEQKRAALKKWKDRNGDNATFENLIAVFNDAGYRAYADETRRICQALTSPAPPQPAPVPVTQPITIATPTVAPSLSEIITHAKTTVESLNRECAPDATVLRQLADCCHPVSIIGPHLQLQEHEMEDIERDNWRSEQKRLDMLKKWHKKFAHKATYLVLVQALVNSGRNDQAADVCKIVAAQQVPIHTLGSGQPPATDGESQPSDNHPPAKTTRAASTPQGVLTTSTPKPLEQHLPDQGHVPSGQYGEYLSVSTDNIQTVYKHWRLEEIHHKLGITGKGTTIAIIDDGLNRSHLSVSNKCARGEIKGYQQWYHDHANHGTAVAAIAAGEGYRNIPSGIAPDANLYIYRLGEKFGAKELSAALDHIINLKEIHIDVVAMSLCLPKNNEKIEGQLAELAKKKIVCIAAAGNSGSLQSGVKFPANDSNVISVGALKDTGQVSSLNPDGGRDIDVYAFGERVLAPSLTATDATSNLDGSSYAVPMVAGFLSLLIQCANTFPHCTKDVQDAYHSVKFLKRHFSTCYGLCDDQRRLMRVGNYFKNLYEHRDKSPSRLVEYYREVYN